VYLRVQLDDATAHAHALVTGFGGPEALHRQRHRLRARSGRDRRFADQLDLAEAQPEGVGVGEGAGAGVTRRLSEADPRVRLDGDNLGPFATLTEEVSHFVYLMFCAGAERRITELELELQGEVDKYLTALAFLSLQSEGAASPMLREARKP